jgi:spore maturation protein CgeB
MKILLPTCRWVGGTLKFVAEAFENMGHQVKFCQIDLEKEISPVTHFLKIRQIKKLQTYITKKLEDAFNKKLLAAVEALKPDLYFSLNCLSVYPWTLKRIREELNVTTVSWVADNPFDTSRFKYFPCNLQHYDHLFLGDRIWEQNIRNAAPSSQLHHLVGAYCPDSFKPVTLSGDDRERFKCNLAFAGTAYGEKAEGKYRAAILSHVADMGLKIWGDNGWELTYPCFPKLADCFQGTRLSFDEVNKMYLVTKINLNLPNPQCITSFQQRIFEIVAAGGFQIVDYRSDIDDYFSDDEMVTFKSIPDLRKKINYFLENPTAREPYIEKARKKVIGVHTYENRMKEMLKKITG